MFFSSMHLLGKIIKQAPADARGLSALATSQVGTRLVAVRLVQEVESPPPQAEAGRHTGSSSYLGLALRGGAD